MCQVRPTTVKLAWQWNVVTLPCDILGLHLWCAAIMHMPPWITPSCFQLLLCLWKVLYADYALNYLFSNKKVSQFLPELLNEIFTMVTNLHVSTPTNMINPSKSHPIMHLLQWRHYERDSVSNHQPHECLLNRLFRVHMKENIIAPVTSEFPSQWPRNAENVSIWWRHHLR